MAEEFRKKKHHFILVHGAGHGAWCWFRIATLLESAGHVVSAMDLAACGVDPKSLDELPSLREYVKPLMEFMELIPDDDGERVVLVGHSYGGVAVAFAMEAFPEKIAVATFVTATVPTPKFPLWDTFQEFQRRSPSDLMDSKLYYGNGPENPPTAITMGRNALASKMYQESPIEDLRLATMLMRPSPLFAKETYEGIQFTEHKFGSVPAAYIVCKEDKMAPEVFQRLMIEKLQAKEVIEIEGSDHMAMFSKPHELFNSLLVVAEKFA